MKGLSARGRRGFRASGRLGAAAVATAAVISCLWGRRAEACEASAILSGPPRDVRQLEALLREQGVVVSQVACPHRSVEASIAPLPNGRGLWLHIQDRYRRASDREVADARTAASLIETWVLDEDGPLFAPRPPVPTAPPAATLAASAAEPPRPEVWHLVGDVEAAAGSDGSLWYGTSVVACRAWKTVCLGGRARLEVDSGLGTAPLSDETVRTASQLMMIAARPLSLGLIVITPVVALGASATRTYDPPVGGDATGTRLDLRLEAEASVMATVAIARRWAVVGEVGASFQGLVEREMANGDGPTLAGPPATSLRAGLGLQYAP